MYTEIALDDMTLRVEESEDGTCYLLTLLVGDNERMGLTLSNSDALVNWIHRDIALCMSSQVLERVQVVDVQPGCATVFGPEPGEPDPLENVSRRWLNRSKGEQAPGEPDLAVWGDALDDALKGLE